MRQLLKIMKFYLSILATFLLFVATTVSAAVPMAPDATLPGPHLVASGEYRFPATIDPDVLDSKMTEVWAKVFYPQDIKSFTEKAPLIVFLHGQHSTCGTGSNPRHDDNSDYAETGTCPPGYVVTPNHEGYNYLAENLASWGYWVVSINTNRGINSARDRLLIDDKMARGKMVLKHLGLLYQWSSKGGAPASIGLGENGLIGKIDFSNVGLMGHSNGGPGVRAAHYLYHEANSFWAQKIPGLTIKGIFEIAGADFPAAYPDESSRLFLNADGVAWIQLVPLCDGEISELGGRMPFERMMLNTKETSTAQKALYEVWGANHDFFNTEWQIPDRNPFCTPEDPDYTLPVKRIFDDTSAGSKEQQTIALASVSAFFRSHVGQHLEPTLNQNFNPLFALPEKISAITQIDRDFTPSPAASENMMVDNFDKETGINSSGYYNVANQIDIKHQSIDTQYEEDHRTEQRTAVISWKTSSAESYFEAVFAAPKKGHDIRGFATLDFRIARTDIQSNPDPITDFSIQLEDANGRLSNSISTSEFVLLNGPIARKKEYLGGDFDKPPVLYFIPILKTARIPLTVFQGVDMKQIRGVRFTFDKTASGSLYLTNIRFQKNMGLGS